MDRETGEDVNEEYKLKVMTYKEESYVLDTLKELKEKIRDMPDVKQMAKEVHENNIMLKAIVRYLYDEAANANNENEQDFGRNVLANMLSNILELNLFNRR